MTRLQGDGSDWDRWPAVSRLWRVGRKVGRTIYAQQGPNPSDWDVLIGVMDDLDLAAEAVRAHNEDLMNEHLRDSGGT